jgi:hypothetical protein
MLTDRMKISAAHCPYEFFRRGGQREIVFEYVINSA